MKVVCTNEGIGNTHNCEGIGLRVMVFKLFFDDSTKFWFNGANLVHESFKSLPWKHTYDNKHITWKKLRAFNGQPEMLSPIGNKNIKYINSYIKFDTKMLWLSIIIINYSLKVLISTEQSDLSNYAN